MSHVEKARDAWGEALPAWVAVLAERCEASSQGKTAKEVGYSASAISYVIGNRYTGDLAAVEQAVRATLMAAELDCPELGAMALSQCLEWRERAKTFQATSSLRRVMYRACRACSVNTGG